MSDRNSSIEVVGSREAWVSASEAVDHNELLGVKATVFDAETGFPFDFGEDERPGNIPIGNIPAEAIDYARLAANASLPGRAQIPPTKLPGRLSFAYFGRGDGRVHYDDPTGLVNESLTTSIMLASGATVYLKRMESFLITDMDDEMRRYRRLVSLGGESKFINDMPAIVRDFTAVHMDAGEVFTLAASPNRRRGRYGVLHLFVPDDGDRLSISLDGSNFLGRRRLWRSPIASLVAMAGGWQSPS
jgi:hypothetical protein